MIYFLEIINMKIFVLKSEPIDETGYKSNWYGRAVVLADSLADCKRLMEKESVEKCGEQITIECIQFGSKIPKRNYTVYYFSVGDVYYDILSYPEDEHIICWYMKFGNEFIDMTP